MRRPRRLPLVQGRRAPLSAMPQRPRHSLEGVAAQLQGGRDVLPVRKLRGRARSEVRPDASRLDDDHRGDSLRADLRDHANRHRCPHQGRGHGQHVGRLRQGLRLQVVPGEPDPRHDGLQRVLQEQDLPLGGLRAPRGGGPELVLAQPARRALRANGPPAVPLEARHGGPHAAVPGGRGGRPAGREAEEGRRLRLRRHDGRGGEARRAAHHGPLGVAPQGGQEGRGQAG
mmetsp:Transcript_18560/g.37807  ORF Transcript_18560/g.37807 Transcript_18560/m.37807 type:complete len:229 (+) Transcript_18560:171-857(+)